MAISFKDSSADAEKLNEAVRIMDEHAKSTYTDGVLGELSSFGGFFQMPKKVKRPVLVAAAGGVGAKLRYAILADKHDVIGADAVATCVNDIVCQGAKPLFFLDCIATGSLSPENAAKVVFGIASGCKKAGAALIGGETAEIQGLYTDKAYDVSGFAVGVADKKNIINGSKIKKGDVLIGLKSNGIHSVGFPFAVKVFGEDIDTLSKYDDDLDAKPVNELLKPAKIYVNSILALIEKVNVLGVVHIKDGGFVANIPKILPEGTGCEINKNSYEVPNVFKVIQNRAGLSDEQMYGTFNMGIGMAVCVRESDADAALRQLQLTGEECVVLGKIVKGSGINFI